MLSRPPPIRLVPSHRPASVEARLSPASLAGQRMPVTGQSASPPEPEALPQIEVGWLRPPGPGGHPEGVPSSKYAWLPGVRRSLRAPVNLPSLRRVERARCWASAEQEGELPPHGLRRRSSGASELHEGPAGENSRATAHGEVRFLGGRKDRLPVQAVTAGPEVRAPEALPCRTRCGAPLAWPSAVPRRACRG